MNNKIPVGISSCLLGEAVRYDGGHKHNSYITQTLGEYFELKGFCPELAIGLGVPRETIHLIATDRGTECVGSKNPEKNVTQALKDCANEQVDWQSQLCGYILKKDSPSCGMERVKLFRNGHPERKGVGIYAAQLMANFPQLPVEEEGRLGDPALRENFIQRVFIYRHWQQLQHQGLSWKALYDFHARYKLTLMSHDQNRARDLGRELSQAQDQALEDYAPRYFAQLMGLLKVIATTKNHVNVLHHIQGYLKKSLDKEDKQELTETIEQYRLGLLPLIVPVSLLRHFFRKHPQDYIENSHYLEPHPRELMLLNRL